MKNFTKLEFSFSIVSVIGPLLFFLYGIFFLQGETRISLNEKPILIQLLGFYALIGAIVFWVHMVIKGFRDTSAIGFLWGVFILLFSFLGAFVYWLYLLFLIERGNK